MCLIINCKHERYKFIFDLPNKNSLWLRSQQSLVRKIRFLAKPLQNKYNQPYYFQSLGPGNKVLAASDPENTFLYFFLLDCILYYLIYTSNLYNSFSKFFFEYLFNQSLIKNTKINGFFLVSTSSGYLVNRSKFEFSRHLPTA